MPFEQAKDFLFTATKKYNLHRQAQASLVCERVKNIFNTKYPEFTGSWIPTKFENGNLVIEVTDSAASSELYLRTMELTDIFEQDETLSVVEEVRIVRKREEYIDKML
ncbi:DUF721 domain-containing protein [Candidatus Gracilibacteria bacterium]|nr:DUF721 domain-containing protein [Candidatus Gracilibacteria bacterium]